jgi:hypothetical protein
MSQPRRRPRGTFLLRRVPEQLIEYPLETLLSAWGFISGLAALVLTDVPSSILVLLPRWAGVVWGLNLLIGGVLIGIGLSRRWYATAVPRGMQLVASACSCYSVAIFAVVGRRGLPTASLLLVIALLLGLRAWYLQVREQMFHDIAREAEL